MPGQVGDAAGALPDVHLAAGDGGKASAIVAAVFQAAQAFDQDRLRFALAHVPDDATHPGVLRKSQFS
jgi:hypothetical protein